MVLFRRGCLLALYCRALVSVRRGVYRPSVVSCWRSIALRLIMVRRGVCRPFLRFVRPLAFYRRAVDNGPPLCLSSVPAVLLALYCPAVGNGPPWRVSSVPAVLLALYCPAVGNGPPWRVSSVPAVLLALYCRAVVLVRHSAVRPSDNTLPPCG